MTKNFDHFEYPNFGFKTSRKEKNNEQFDL